MRIISSTNRDLVDASRRRCSARISYFRLNVIHISDAGRLRERREDIPLLLNHFLGAFAPTGGASIAPPERGGADHLSGYGWPGNVRQLKNTAERLIARSGSRDISVADLQKRSAISDGNQPPRRHTRRL